MGALGQSIMRVTEQKLGRLGWQRKVDLVERFWTSVAAIVFTDLALPFAQTRLYQDGLPVCGKEDEIVADIAAMGSPNHQLLLRLKDQGARIMGTESAELLIEEYQLAKRLLGAKDAGEAMALEVEQKTTSDLLLARRDAYIAARIGETLQPGETGILFLGLLHDPLGRLASDIEVICPLGAGPRQGTTQR
jgi:hypothetical protein